MFKKAALIIFLCSFAVFSIALKNELRRAKSPVAGLKLEQPMPDFTLPGRDGQPVKLTEVLRTNKIVMVNFWASWCGPCRIEMPGFEQLYKTEKGNGFAILAISEDEDLTKLDAYLKSKPVMLAKATYDPRWVPRAFALLGYYLGPAKTPGDLLDDSFSKTTLHINYWLPLAVLGENLLYVTAVLILAAILFRRRELRIR